MTETNMTLLTQEEIDALIHFLKGQSQGMTQEVLSQESIDKLIRMIRGKEVGNANFDRLLNHVTNEKCLRDAGLRGEDQICQLIASIGEDGFVKLSIKNISTGKEVIVTPEGFAKQDFSITESKWGYCIMPAFFDQIAKIYGLEYTKENYDFVCELYAEKNFGDKNYEISSAFLPDEGMISRLLEA